MGEGMWMPPAGAGTRRIDLGASNTIKAVLEKPVTYINLTVKGTTVRLTCDEARHLLGELDGALRAE